MFNFLSLDRIFRIWVNQGAWYQDDWPYFELNHLQSLASIFHWRVRIWYRQVPPPKHRPLAWSWKYWVFFSIISLYFSHFRVIYLFPQSRICLTKYFFQRSEYRFILHTRSLECKMKRHAFYPPPPLLFTHNILPLGAVQASLSSSFSRSIWNRTGFGM